MFRRFYFKKRNGANGFNNEQLTREQQSFEENISILHRSCHL